FGKLWLLMRKLTINKFPLPLSHFKKPNYHSAMPRFNRIHNGAMPIYGVVQIPGSSPCNLIVSPYNLRHLGFNPYFMVYNP
ncbi:MAG: hypothetical protein WDM71_03580, partial [Ferruginibacter sp.]